MYLKYQLYNSDDKLSEVSLETFGSFVRNFHIGFDHDHECH